MKMGMRISDTPLPTAPITSPVPAPDPTPTDDYSRESMGNSRLASAVITIFALVLIGTIIWAVSGIIKGFSATTEVNSIIAEAAEIDSRFEHVDQPLTQRTLSELNSKWKKTGPLANVDVEYGVIDKEGKLIFLTRPRGNAEAELIYLTDFSVPTGLYERQFTTMTINIAGQSRSAIRLTNPGAIWLWNTDEQRYIYSAELSQKYTPQQ